MLLEWATLEPAGPANLAAIRFTEPVRVHSISIFPTTAQPFAQCPDIVARTEPQSFFLDIFFNAHPAPQPHGGERPKPTNALVPTRLAYAGGSMDFLVNMSPEYGTRLMIVKGDFQCVSMAIYGEILQEPRAGPSTYEPRALPSVEPIPLPRSLDPANMRDPSSIARELLKLIPNAPPLPLVIRLMLSLKPSNEDWDLPDFPYLHPNLEGDLSGLDLEKAFRLTMRPVSDDIMHEPLQRFAEAVSRSLRSKDHNSAYLVAGILCHAAVQHPEMARTLVETLEFEKIFEPSNMDELTLLRLLNAVSNPDVARCFDQEWFLSLVSSVAKDATAEAETRKAAHDLLARIRGWAILEDALSNTQSQFMDTVDTLKTFGADEQALGIWLAAMITHQNIVAALDEIPVLPTALPHPPFLFRTYRIPATHDEFVGFIRAYIGIASVLAVYAWSDSLPDPSCRERILGILRLWQGVDGYREILNHLLSLRQMTLRLEWNIDYEGSNNEDSARGVPTRGGLDAEHILFNLAKDPQAILQHNVTKCIMALRPPLAHITEDERLSMRQAAAVVEDGLPGAIDELLRPVERPVSLRSLRTLRVAVAVLDQELGEEKGEWRVLEDFWDEGSCDIVSCLSDIFLALADEVKGRFGLDIPAPAPSELLPRLFNVCDELLRLLLRLIPVYALPGRTLRSLVVSVTDLFACTDQVDLLYSQTSPTCVAAQETRQTCFEFLRMLADPRLPLIGGKLNTEVVLRTLLEHALHPMDCDPAHHLLQSFCLVEYLLPMPDSADDQKSVWIHKVIPTVLTELWAFCRALDTENKAHFVKRLVHLDRGVVGVGDWLLLQELKQLLQAAQSLDDFSQSLQYRALRQYQVSLSLRFLLELTDESSSVAEWAFNCMATVHDITNTLLEALRSLYDQYVESAELTRLVQTLATEHSKFDADLTLIFALSLLRATQDLRHAPDVLDRRLELISTMLKTVPPNRIDGEQLRQEFGTLLSKIGQAETVELHTAEMLVSMVEIIVEKGDGCPQLLTLDGLDLSAFSTLCSRLQETLPEDWKLRLDAVQGRLSFEQDVSPTIPSVQLAEKMELSIHELDALMRANMPPPSTPLRTALHQDALSLATFSPPALFRSPATTGLTKTYLNNDFRQLRQTPAARQNTSRLPSMHVDVGVPLAA
ncbi:hypothetical protein CERSUDRAFT_130228 [Gelatoporia subvermispora B]|uniref:Virilizer N-terminal domain-containing protein n=1 Tax=Ceriporiopsis subvermispora (strain B) TaxID=914234 RepID=M2RNI1_CERS8|nr:hypothetical protein CERSUDRAFT_130228 [Gelatoporia subvermispora B]